MKAETKKELAERIKLYLKKIYQLDDGLANCEESYECLKGLNKTILIKLDKCLFTLAINKE